MECVPTVRAEVVNEAEPFERAPVPRTVDPSRNCTAPVAEPELTPALKVTAFPANEGFPFDVTEMVVAILVTVCMIAAELAFK